MTASNGQTGNRGSGNGSAATSREAGPDPANPQLLQPARTRVPARRLRALPTSLAEFSSEGSCCADASYGTDHLANPVCSSLTTMPDSSRSRCVA